AAHEALQQSAVAIIGRRHSGQAAQVPQDGAQWSIHAFGSRRDGCRCYPVVPKRSRLHSTPRRFFWQKKSAAGPGILERARIVFGEGSALWTSTAIRNRPRP